MPSITRLQATTKEVWGNKFPRLSSYFSTCCLLFSTHRKHDSHLKADFVVCPLAVLLDSVGGGHGGGVDGAVVGHDQAVAAVVQLEPRKVR